MTNLQSISGLVCSHLVSRNCHLNGFRSFLSCSCSSYRLLCVRCLSFLFFSGKGGQQMFIQSSKQSSNHCHVERWTTLSPTGPKIKPKHSTDKRCHFALVTSFDHRVCLDYVPSDNAEMGRGCFMSSSLSCYQGEIGKVSLAHIEIFCFQLVTNKIAINGNNSVFRGA